MERALNFLSCKKIRVFLVCYIFLQFSAFSNNPVFLNDLTEDFRISDSQLQILADEDGKLNLKKVLSSNQFIDRESFTDNNTQSWYWIKFSLIDNSSEEKNWILQLPLHTELVTFYIQSPEGKFKVYDTGQLKHFNSRSIDIRTLAFDLPIKKGIPYNCYVRIHSKKHIDFSFIISSVKVYLEVHTKAYLFLGFIYGILFLMAFYNLILFISIRERLYLYYVLYTMFSIFFLLWKDGLGFQFLWPGIPAINSIHYNAGLLLLLVSFLLFAINFLELKYQHQKLFQISYILIGLNFIYFLISSTDVSFFDPLPYIYIISYCYFLGITFYYIQRGYKPAYYLAISLTCIISALSVIKLRYLGLMEWNWFVEYILNFALVAEAIIMSLASSDKITYLRKEKDKVREKILLEEKLKAENELINLKNDGLETELKFRNNELAALATSLTQKVELFSHIKNDLISASNELPVNAQIKKIIKKIEQESDFENHWTQFQLNFDKVHQNFLSNLSASHPMLKPADLLLCAYIKMGKSNKEIAPLLNISISGVEKKRLRVKEKLKLENDNRLTDFILNFK